MVRSRDKPKLNLGINIDILLRIEAAGRRDIEIANDF